MLPKIHLTWESYESGMLTFKEEFRELFDQVDLITGPGRSGAIVSSHLSNQTGKGWVAWKQKIPDNKKLIIVDTAFMSGKTIKKAVNQLKTVGVTIWDESQVRIYFPWEKPSCVCVRGHVNIEPKVWR